ncbi:hypothetical protein [Candidatus Electronema sp. TJ]|uniref:hypothetical protein n=1 Tax=Candidatus Electronema sp. TJ TaxID=3401573 RepID=UPI003AA8742E
MIQSEILKEKERVQAMLSAESSSVHEYLLRARRAAEEAAACYGFTLCYADEAELPVPACDAALNSPMTFNQHNQHGTFNQ